MIASTRFARVGECGWLVRCASARMAAPPEDVRRLALAKRRHSPYRCQRTGVTLHISLRRPDRPARSARKGLPRMSPPPTAGPAPPGIAVVLGAQLMLILDATVVNVALPHIDHALDFGPAGLSWVLNASTLAFGGLLLLGGRLGDVFGRRRTFEIGLAVFTLASKRERV